MKRYILFSGILLLSSYSFAQDCNDDLQEIIYDQCITPYFLNLNTLIGFGPQYVRSDKYRIWKNLFAESSDLYIPQDFVSKNHDDALSDHFQLGDYILELQDHWGKSGSRFKIPLRDEIYYARYNGQYIVCFNKYISGDLQVKGDIIPDAISSFWIELSLNSNFKITAVRLPDDKRQPIDKDNDNIIDFYNGKKTDESPQKGLLKYNGRPDSDCDGIEDRLDECPKEGQPNRVTNKGCPDSDSDGIADTEDRAPFAAGTKKCKGDADTDGDGTCDYADDCVNEFGRRRDGCPRPLKSYILTFKPYYSACLPLARFKSSNVLNGPNFDWTEKSGFASRSFSNFGISLSILPFRNFGLSVDAFLWQTSFDTKAFAHALNTYYSRRIANFETANTSASAYGGICLTGKLPIGLFQRRFSVRLEPQYGICIPNNNSLSMLIAIRDAQDVSQSIDLMPDKFPVYGLGLNCSKQLNWKEKHIGLEVGASYLRGDFSPSPQKIDLFQDVKEIDLGSSLYEMLTITIGINFSFWEPANNRQ